jgi:L-asparaginase/Glu-tRNA(Gln) amidotransferase subunit D
MLENLSTPVIVTSNNLLSTLIASSNTKIPEVMVFSHDKLLRGCSVINIGKDVFISPKIGQLNQTNALQRPDGLFQVKPFNPQIKVSIVNESLINRVDGVDGVVIDSKGDGSSLLSPNTLEIITNLMKKGTIVVIVLQDQQNINKSLASTGITHCNDITATAASAKLNFLLSNVQDRKLIDQLMKKSFRGEMSNST